MSDPQSTDPAPPLPGLSEEEAGRRRAAGQGNDVQIRTGRTYGRIVRDNVFNFINNLFYVLGVVLLALGKPLDAFVVVFVILVWIRNTIGGVPFVESVRMSTVILALVPNGLVLSTALTYALGAVRLLGKGMLVQQFNAVESLSNVDVLC